MKQYNTLELAKVYPEAWQALPECYREDDVLIFTWKDGYLSLEVKPDQQDVVGCFTGYFWTDTWIIS